LANETPRISAHDRFMPGPAQLSMAQDVLTARELQVAVLIVQGLAYEAIGRRLGASPSTVGAHLARAYSKLGVSNRSALAARIAGTVALHRRPAESAPAAE
jgi:DNA-binding CsgD family transcriptional regulator